MRNVPEEDLVSFKKNCLKSVVVGSSHPNPIGNGETEAVVEGHTRVVMKREDDG